MWYVSATDKIIAIIYSFYFGQIISIEGKISFRKRFSWFLFASQSFVSFRWPLYYFDRLLSLAFIS